MAADPRTQAGLEEIVVAATALSGVTIEEAHRAGVLAHLSISLAIARKIGPVGAEAAPQFRP